ncbi:hypothetical protein TNCV_3375361 [Trichonephila clavipes]|nr:hypothetical protein TNCV_3375361 [Trichonephila clavipes]
MHIPRLVLTSRHKKGSTVALTSMFSISRIHCKRKVVGYLETGHSSPQTTLLLLRLLKGSKGLKQHGLTCSIQVQIHIA